MFRNLRVLTNLRLWRKELPVYMFLTRSAEAIDPTYLNEPNTIQHFFTIFRCARDWRLDDLENYLKNNPVTSKGARHVILAVFFYVHIDHAGLPKSNRLAEISETYLGQDFRRSPDANVLGWMQRIIFKDEVPARIYGIMRDELTHDHFAYLRNIRRYKKIHHMIFTTKVTE